MALPMGIPGGPPPGGLPPMGPPMGPPPAPPQGVPRGTTPQKYGILKKMTEGERLTAAGEWEDKIKRGIVAGRPAKLDMQEADKFWLGEHWDDSDPEWMPKPSENWVFATVEQHSANLSTSNVVPIITGQDPGDEDVAKMFDYVIQYLWQPNKLNLRRLIRRAIHGAMLRGTAIAKVYWDNTKNGGRQFDEARNFTNPLNQQPYTATHTLYKGEVCVELVDPSNVIHDPSGYSLSGPGACGWIAIRLPRKREWVENNPKYQEYLTPEELKRAFDQTGSTASRADVEFYHGRPINSPQNSDEIMHDEIWVRRMDQFGNWHIDYLEKIGSQIIYYAEDVYKDGEFPLAILYDYEVDKSFFGMGEPKQVIPNNKTINHLSRLAALNAMHMTNTQKVVTHDSGIDPKEVATFGTMPGAVWKSRTVDGIKPLEVSEIPVSVFKVAESAREGIRTIMAMDESNMGQFGGSVTAASGIKMIQDKAGVRDNDKGVNVEDFVSRLVSLIISRVQQFYTTERYVPIVGKRGNMQQFFPFIGGDYQDISLLVSIESGSGTPTNKGAIEEKAWKMWDNQSQQKFDPPLITIEELLDTLQAFPLKERIKQRVKNANSQQAAQEAVQLAQFMQQLMAQGIDPNTIPPEQLIQLQQQIAAQVQATQGGAPPNGTPPGQSPQGPPPQGQPPQVA
jgi:hypothetical protein